MDEWRKESEISPDRAAESWGRPWGGKKNFWSPHPLHHDSTKGKSGDPAPPPSLHASLQPLPLLSTFSGVGDALASPSALFSWTTRLLSWPWQPLSEGAAPSSPGNGRVDMPTHAPLSFPLPLLNWAARSIVLASLPVSTALPPDLGSCMTYKV